MNPRQVLETLEEVSATRSLSEAERDLYELVKRVVARVDALGELLFTNRPEGSKDLLSTHKAELFEYVELMGPAMFGDLKPLPEPEVLGITDEETALQNRKIFNRRTEARVQGWFIEAIALTAYQLEDWLRTWIVARGGGEHFHNEDRQQLSQLINEAEGRDLDPDFVGRLRSFNQIRNRAIHRLLRGEVPYEALADAYDADSLLPKDLTDWVISNLPTFEQAANGWHALSRWRNWAESRDEDTQK